MNDTELYRRAFEFAGDAFFIHDYNGTIRLVNEAACAQLGYRREELQGMSVLEVDALPDRARLESYINELVRAGDLRFETEHLSKTGERLPVEVHSTTITYHGEPLVMSMARDIGARKKAERSLQVLSRTAVQFITMESEEQLHRHVVESLAAELPEALVFFSLYDPEQELLCFKASAGLKPEERRYLARNGVVPEVLQYRLEEQEREQLQNGRVQSIDAREFVQRKLGFRGALLRTFTSYITGRETQAIGITREGELYGGLLVAYRGQREDWRDNFIEAFAYQAAAALEHQRLLEQLRRERRRAEEAYEQKSAFFAGVSHEIRTPLNGVLGFTELLAKELKGSEAEHYVQSIQRSGQSLLELVNDILDLSKIEAGKMDIRPEPMNLYGLLEEIYRLFQQTAEGKGISLTFVLSPGLPDCYYLDPSRLRQVLINLVSNAVKYTTSVSVELVVSGEAEPRRETADLRVDVSDTGQGISPSLLPYIFEPYNQGSRKSQKSGVGLGLAITRRLLELMGGSVEVQSTPGEGTTFTVRLPGVPLAPRGEQSDPELAGCIWGGGTVEIKSGAAAFPTAERAGGADGEGPQSEEQVETAAHGNSGAGPSGEDAAFLLERWREVRMSGSFREIADFGRLAQQYGQRNGSRRMDEYGGRLLSVAEQFDVARLREILEEFAGILEVEGGADSQRQEEA
jgi:PAS domain S-box-containing protein